MQIGELAKRTGIAASRIRFCERQRVLPEAVRAENGYREYPEAAVKTLRLIDDAQQLGFALREIRNGLVEAAPKLPSRQAMIVALQFKLESVDQHMIDVRARRRELVRLLKGLTDC